MSKSAKAYILDNADFLKDLLDVKPTSLESATKTIETARLFAKGIYYKVKRCRSTPRRREAVAT